MMSVLLATGCSNESEEVLGSTPVGDSSRSTSTTARGDLLPCQNMISTDEAVPEDYEVLLDVIALPTANSAPRALQVGRHDGTDLPSYFAKTGLLVRSGAAFDLEVEIRARLASVGDHRPNSPQRFQARVAGANPG